MGQGPSKKKELFTSMNELVTMKFSPEKLESTLKFARQTSFRLVEEHLHGLSFDFDQYRTREGNNFVLIRIHGGTIPEGSPRVTTTNGFMTFYQYVQELATALSLLRWNNKRLEQQQPVEESTISQQQPIECAICMDREVDTVLSCGHEICFVCQMEWLVGEGRGTCPMCRSFQKEGDEWVLNNPDFSDDKIDISRRIKQLTLSILSFLSSLPTFEEFSDVYNLSLNNAGKNQQDDDDDDDEKNELSMTKDGLTYFLKGEVAFLKDFKHENIWGRCLKCMTITRIPISALDDTRFVCYGCKSIWQKQELLLVQHDVFKNE